MQKKHFLGSEDTNTNFTKYYYCQDEGKSSIVSDTENWSGNDVDSAKLSENSTEYELTKEQTSMVEQALEYKKCERALKKWAISFVDFKNGKRDEKSFSCDNQMLLRKIAINRANNIKKISEEKNGETKQSNSCFIQKSVEKFKETFFRS